jgi:hypothetical protein
MYSFMTLSWNSPSTAVVARLAGTATAMAVAASPRTSSSALSSRVAAAPASLGRRDDGGEVADGGGVGERDRVGV